MGYILPITHFEYTDYQRRVIKDKEGLQYVEKPFKIKLDMQKQFKYDQDFTNEMMRERQQPRFEEAKLTNPRKEQTIAKITGKGSLFNESV